MKKGAAASINDTLAATLFIYQLLFDFLNVAVDCGLNGSILNRGDSAPCKYEADLIGTYAQGNDVILDAGDGAVDAADGAYTVAGLDAGKHLLDLLLTLALRNGHNEEEADHQDEHDYESPAPEAAAGRAGFAAGRAAAGNETCH